MIWNKIPFILLPSRYCKVTDLFIVERNPSTRHVPISHSAFSPSILFFSTTKLFILVCVVLAGVVSIPAVVAALEPVVAMVTGVVPGAVPGVVSSVVVAATKDLLAASSDVACTNSHLDQHGDDQGENDEGCSSGELHGLVVAKVIL